MDSVHVTQETMGWKSDLCMPALLELPLHCEDSVVCLHANRPCNLLQNTTFWQCGGAPAVLFPALVQAFLKGQTIPESAENPAGYMFLGVFKYSLCSCLEKAG